ncbi:hypothetical protein LCGC14_0820710 [marine sediment metagenome]|uniref:Uncharacterized protein n=1 Tax=marine sediment metagenome TaxID=412755 RepID=A0A0F9S3U1_9ZZZZ
MGMMIEKIARKKESVKETGSIKKPVIAIVSGSVIAKASWPALTGRKKVYHGTTRKAFEGIKREGIRPKYVGGASRGLPQPEKLVRGRVYVTEKPRIGRLMMHQALHPKAARRIERTGWEAAGKFITMQYRTPKRGKLLTVMMDYDKWKKMKADPEMLAAMDFDVALDVATGGKIPQKVPPGHPMYKQIKAVSAHGRQIISPSEIRGASKVRERAARVLKNLPKYIKKYPGRFSLAVAGTLAGSGLVGYGIKGIAEKFRNTKK